MHSDELKVLFVRFCRLVYTWLFNLVEPIICASDEALTLLAGPTRMWYHTFAASLKSRSLL